MWLRTMALLGLVAVAGGCGGAAADAPVEPETGDFDVDPHVQDEIDEAAETGDGAEGSYAHDDQAGTLTVTISASSFACGIEPGDTFTAIITELTATTMVWEFTDGDGGVTWTRIDNSAEVSVIGIWTTTDPDLYLVLGDDGAAQIFGADMDCSDDDRPRNGDNCLEMGLTGNDIFIDGDLSDWNGLNQDAILTDDAGDHDGGDAGADLKALKVEFFGSSLMVLLQLHGAPSTEFQNRPPPQSGSYRLTVRGDNGLSVQEVVFYDPGSGAFVTQGYAANVTAAAGADGIEWAVDVSGYDGPGFEQIDMIMVEAIDCGSGACEYLDAMDCGYVGIPQ